jgi:AraC-like DNA-binding protein
MTAAPWVLVDVGLRGAAMALLGLLAVSGLRGAGRGVGERYSVPFDVCAIAYLVETAPGLRDSHAWWIVPVRLLSLVTPGVFLLWTQAACSDGFAPRWWRWLPAGAMLGLGVWATATDSWLAWRTSQGAALLLAALGIYTALDGRAADLVEARRRTRLVFACGVGACIAVTTLAGAVRLSAVPAVSVVLGLALTAALLRLRLERAAEGATLAAPAASVPVMPAAVGGEEQALQAQLERAMTQERAYREGGLTVAALAQRLGVPEYRLRRLINQRLGHRNFVSFVNGYRLAEAMAALADAGQARVPVLTIALDAGFQSIGPFNRAFKAQTGETPSEFRARCLVRQGKMAAN